MQGDTGARRARAHFWGAKREAALRPREGAADAGSEAAALLGSPSSLGSPASPVLARAISARSASTGSTKGCGGPCSSACKCSHGGQCLSGTNATHLTCFAVSYACAAAAAHSTAF